MYLVIEVLDTQLPNPAEILNCSIQPPESKYFSKCDIQFGNVYSPILARTCTDSNYSRRVPTFFFQVEEYPEQLTLVFSLTDKDSRITKFNRSFETLTLRKSGEKNVLPKAVNGKTQVIYLYSESNERFAIYFKIRESKNGPLISHNSMTKSSVFEQNELLKFTPTAQLLSEALLKVTTEDDKHPSSSNSRIPTADKFNIVEQSSHFTQAEQYQTIPINQCTPAPLKVIDQATKEEITPPLIPLSESPETTSNQATECVPDQVSVIPLDQSPKEPPELSANPVTKSIPDLPPKPTEISSFIECTLGQPSDLKLSPVDGSPLCPTMHPSSNYYQSPSTYQTTTPMFPPQYPKSISSEINQFSAPVSLNPVSSKDHPFTPGKQSLNSHVYRYSRSVFVNWTPTKIRDSYRSPKYYESFCSTSNKPIPVAMSSPTAYSPSSHSRTASAYQCSQHSGFTSSEYSNTDQLTATSEPLTEHHSHSYHHAKALSESSTSSQSKSVFSYLAKFKALLSKLSVKFSSKSKLPDDPMATADNDQVKLVMSNPVDYVSCESKSRFSFKKFQQHLSHKLHHHKKKVKSDRVTSSTSPSKFNLKYLKRLLFHSSNQFVVPVSVETSSTVESTTISSAGEESECYVLPPLYDQKEDQGKVQERDQHGKDQQEKFQEEAKEENQESDIRTDSKQMMEKLEIVGMHKTMAENNRNFKISLCRQLEVKETVGLALSKNRRRLVLCYLDVARFAELMGITYPQWLHEGNRTPAEIAELTTGCGKILEDNVNTSVSAFLIVLNM